MSQRWRVLLAIIFTLFWLGLVSWHDGYNYQYCNDIEKCSEYNILVYGWLTAAHFTHKFESLFVVFFTAGLAIFTWQLRDATVALNDSTERLWQAGERQIIAAQTSADAAKASADASLLALRPWLSHKVEIAGPLSFSNGSAYFDFQFTVKNIGKSPALGVKIEPFLTLFSPKHEAAIIRLVKLAEMYRSLPVKTTQIHLPSGTDLGEDEKGMVLFPDQSHSFRYKLPVPSVEIEKAVEDLADPKFISPIICGLIIYNYPLANVRGITGFSHVLRTKKSNNKGVFLIGEPIAANNIFVELDFMSMGFAT